MSHTDQASASHSLGYGNPERTYGQWWDWKGPWVRADITELEAFCLQCYEVAGLTRQQAADRLDHALDKTIQGDHARGLVYFPGNVRAVKAARDQGIDVERVEILRDNAATALVGGRGQVNRVAMGLAIDKANQYGVGIVGSQAAGGILTPYVKMAADAGMVGIMMTQTAPGVAPFGGFTPMLGNGPFAVGIPVAGHDPVIVDMAFTQSSASGILLAAEQGAEIPEGLLLDEHGTPSTNSRDFSDFEHNKAGSMSVKGTLTPLGNSHKGYAMLFTIGALCSTLTNTDFPWDLKGYPPDRKFGSIHFAINPETLTGFDIAPRMQTFVETLSAAPRKPGVERILYPGERSQELRRERRQRGSVDVPESHIAAMRALAEELGVPVPATFANLITS